MPTSLENVIQHAAIIVKAKGVGVVLFPSNNYKIDTYCFYPNGTWDQIVKSLQRKYIFSLCLVFH